MSGVRHGAPRSTVIGGAVLSVAYVFALRLMISSEMAMAILSSGGHFPAWAIAGALLTVLLRVVVFVVLPAALFAKLGMMTIDAWPEISRFAVNFRRK